MNKFVTRHLNQLLNRYHHILRCMVIPMLMVFYSGLLPAQRNAPNQTDAKKLKLKADSCFWKQDLKGAEKYYELSYKAFTTQKNIAYTATLLSDLANIDYNYGKLNEAITKCRMGLEVLKQSPNDTVDFRISSFLSAYYKLKYQEDSADFYNIRSEKLIEKSPLVKSREEAVYFYSNQTAFSLMVNDFKKVETYFEKAYNLSKYTKNPDFGVLYNNLASSYFRQRKFKEAKKNFELALKNQISFSGGQEIIYINLAYCNIKLKEWTEAQANQRIAWASYQLKLKKERNEPLYYLEKHYYIVQAEYFKGLNQWGHSLKNYQLSLNAGPIKYGDYAMTAYVGIAQLYDAQNQPLKALGFYQKALNAAHETFSSTDIYQNPALDRILTERELFRALMGKANAFRQFYTQTRQRRDLEAALKTYQLAIQLAEKMRRSYQSAGAKLFFTENYYAVYEQAIQTAQELYQLTQKPDYQSLIFDFYEKSRAASLSDIVRDTDLKPKTINAALLAQEKGLYQQITGLQAAIKRSDSTTAVKVKAQLVDKEIELDRLTKRFERDFPAYYQLKYDTKTASATTIQQQLLSPDAALIQYFLTSNQLYILVLTREQSKVVVQPIDSTFRPTVSKFRGLLSLNPGSKVYDGNAYSSTLYFKLIAPVLPFVSTKKRLLIVRDAELNYLPFEVLAAKLNDYLFKKYAISYAYSVGLLMNLSPPRSSNNRLSIAPFAGNISQKATFRGEPLVPLPASEEEVRQIGGDVYVEKEATKKRFLEQYREHGIIHFATHALTDDKDPMRSFVAFYPDGQEYRLFTNELYDLDLKEAQLVVLSACETGAGRLQRGEGVMSLARAFAYAGAQSVATTLWNANDEATAYISTHFHEYINDGLSLDEALQRAKLDFLKSDLGRRYDHPYYWANMVLIGRTDPIEKGTVLWWWVVVGGLILVVGVGGLLKYRSTTQKSQLR